MMDVTGLEWLLVVLAVFAFFCAGIGFYSLARSGAWENRHSDGPTPLLFK